MLEQRRGGKRLIGATMVSLALLASWLGLFR
jgi:hypothetical protein